MRQQLVSLLLAFAAVGAGCAGLPDVVGGVAGGVVEDRAGMESAPIHGNKVTLLFDGPRTLSAMEAAITAAKSSIHLETYIFDQDAIGMRFAELLMERQQAGVKTRIIYDSIGTVGTPDAFFERLRSSGIELLAFNPVNPLKLREPWAPNNRDHRKILVVDGRVAFTGGVNISQAYSSSSLFRSKAKPKDGRAIGWRDTHLQLEGPAVASLQSLFLRTWNAHVLPVVPTDDLFPPLAVAGNKVVRVIASEPGGKQEVHTAYIEAIRAAQLRVYLTSAYFVPDAPMLTALQDAARRGVDVRVVVPGVQEGGMVFYAGRSFFEAMLDSGMRIFQMREAVLHAKTAVIDGRWSTVGSTNMDTRSFLHNSEINLIVLDQAFGTDMEAAFAEDMGDSDEVLLPLWRQRPWADRIREWAARQFDYWL